MNRTIVAAATGLLLTGIILGAFGAHSLKEVLAPEKLVSFETGVKYQFYLGLGLLVLGLNSDRFGFDMKWVYRFNLVGVLCFSGSIYLLALQEVMNVSLSFLWPVTPLGGLFMIVGWSILFLNLIRKRA